MKEDDWTGFELYRDACLLWRPTDNGGYLCQVGETQLRLRLSDFPSEPMWTLFANGQPLVEFNHWPPSWRR